MLREPSPGEWLSPAQFQEVVCVTPLVAIDLVVRSPEGRVLVGQRKNEPARGTYFVPGSRITKNETLAGAFQRITREELGLERQLGEARFLGVYEHFYGTNRFEVAGFGTHYIVLAHELTGVCADRALPEDQHGDYRWLTVQELLDSPQVHANTKAYFKSGAAA